MSAARQLPSPATGITSEVIRVTPEMAEKWLGRNNHNRHVRAQDVARYTRAMTRNEWLLTGEAIKFATNGDLLDGQHRLMAVFESQKTIAFMVIKGLPAETQDVLDTGRARTAADQASIHGHSNPSVLASAARLCLLWESGRFYINPKAKVVSHREILDFVEDNVMLAFAVSQASQTARGSGLPPSVAAMTFYYLLPINDDAASEFANRLTDGVNLPSGSPILAARERLQAIRRDRTRLPNEALISLVFRAWNLWRSNKRVASLPLYHKGELIACPQPK